MNPYRDPSAGHYHYRVAQVTWDKNRNWQQDLEKVLNNAAEDGWEPHMLTDSGGAFTLILRK